MCQHIIVKEIFPCVDFSPLWGCSLSTSLEHEYQDAEYIIAVLL